MEIQQYLSDTCPLRIHIPINNKKDNDFSMLNRYCEDSLCDRPNDSQPSFFNFFSKMVASSLGYYHMRNKEVVIIVSIKRKCIQNIPFWIISLRT